jgi:hypothetical protein
MVGKIAQVSWIDGLQILFYFGLVERVCYPSICSTGGRYRCQDVTDISCVLPALMSSEQAVCSYWHWNTDSSGHHKLTPIAVGSEVSKLPMKPHKSWRHGSATRVAWTCCGYRFSVRNRADTLRYSYESQWEHETSCSLITQHTAKYFRELADNILRVGSITEIICCVVSHLLSKRCQASCHTCCPNGAKHTFRWVDKHAPSEQLCR